MTAWTAQKMYLLTSRTLSEEELMELKEALNDYCSMHLKDFIEIWIDGLEN